MGKDSLSVAVDLRLTLTLQSFHHWTDMRERDPPIWGPEPPHLNPGSAVVSRSALGFFFSFGPDGRGTAVDRGWWWWRGSLLETGQAPPRWLILAALDQSRGFAVPPALQTCRY